MHRNLERSNQPLTIVQHAEKAIGRARRENRNLDPSERTCISAAIAYSPEFAQRHAVALAEAVLASVKAEDGRRRLTPEEQGIIEAAEKISPEFRKKMERPAFVPPAQAQAGSSPEHKQGWLTKEQRVFDVTRHKHIEQRETLSLAKVFRGIALGRWDGAEAEHRALGGGTPSAGGYMLPLDVSSQVIDFARAGSVCVAAGAVTFPTEGKFDIPRLETDVTPAAEWKAENATLTADSDVTFGAVQTRPKTLMAILRASVELVEDAAPPLEELIAQTLRRSMGLQLDQAGLFGAGTLEPTGLYNDSNVAKTTINGPITYSAISQASELVSKRNYVPDGLVLGWGSYYTLDRLLATGGDEQPLRGFPSYERLAKFPTSSVDDQVGDPAFVGQWNQLAFAVRTDFRVEVSRYDTDSLRKLQLAFRCYGRFDVGVMSPGAFQVLDQLGS